jgi:hypothetical protein
MPRAGDQPVFPHQPRRPVPTDLVAVIHPATVQARAAIPAKGQGESHSDISEIDKELRQAPTGNQALPRKEPLLINFYRFAHLSDSKYDLLAVNIDEPH